MSSRDNAAFITRILQLVEQGEASQVAALYHPEVEFHWPPGLPYSGDFKGRDIASMTERFVATWVPLRPNEDTRRMDARILALGDDGHVIVHYMWRGLDGKNRRFETEALADYQVKDGRLIRAQMFYYDLPGLIAFLDTARLSSVQRKP